MKRYFYDGVRVTYDKFKVLTDGAQVRSTERYTEDEQEVEQIEFRDGSRAVIIEDYED